MSILDFIKNKTMLLDGSTGSALMLMGIESGSCPEIWNIENKQNIANLAKNYFEAGSDAVLTNTFGGSSIKLADYNLADKAYDIVYNGVCIAKEEALKFENKFVIASVGPTGKFMEPIGELTEADMIEGFAIQVKAINDAKADAIILETFTDISEIIAASKAVKENSDLPFIASMTFDKNPSTGKYNTIMGTSVAQAYDTIMSIGAIACGSNCGNGLLNMVEIMKEYRIMSKDTPLWTKPNAGLPEYRDGKTVYTEDENFFAENIHQLLECNVNFIGGCCGSTYGHIKKMREVLG